MSIDFIPAQFAHGEYGFKKAGQSDFSKIRHWLDAKHLSDWWTPSEEELGAIQASEPGHAAYIVDHQGWAFAYLHLTDPAYDPVLSEQLSFPAGTVKLDQFVGDAQMIGFGHGVKFIKAFVAAARGIPGVKKLLVTPAKGNVFAARSFSQSGFRPEKNLELIQGPVTVMGVSVA